jgi:hypothetical protein
MAALLHCCIVIAVLIYNYLREALETGGRIWKKGFVKRFPAILNFGNYSLKKL